MENVIVYSYGLANLSACVKADLTKDQIEKEINLLHPTGIASKWKISKDKTFGDGNPNPCPCNDHPTKRKHYLLTC